MFARRGRSHSAVPASDISVEASYRGWKAHRPQLFRQRSQPSTVPMEGITPVHIAVIADNQDHLVPLPNAIHHPSQTRSLISKPKAFATLGRIVPCAATIIAPSSASLAALPLNASASSRQPIISSATITLRWRYEHGLQSFQETFYIVDAATVGVGVEGDYDAVLRGDIEVTPAEGALPQANPIYVGTPGRGGRAERDKREEEKKRKESEYRDQVERQREKVRAELDGKGRR